MSKKNKEQQISLLDRLENFCSQHHRFIAISILSVFSLLSFFLFNLRVSEGGDDSTYIMRAANFIKEGSYPSFQGPVYPMFLSIFVLIFGVKIGWLKLTSFFTLLAGMYFFYRIFKKRINYTLLLATMLMLSVSGYFLYFASQTYSEALYILLQLPVFALLFSDIEDQSDDINIKRLTLLSLFVVLGYFTRTIGLSTFIAVLTFFLINKEYKKVGILSVCTIFILFALLGLKMMIWDTALFEGGQASTLMYKHPYDKSQGQETIGGFIQRFWDNSQLYLSKHFLKMVGLRAASVKSVKMTLVILLYAIFVYGFIRSLKKNKYILFVALYTAITLGITFLVLQKLWDQYRLIVPVFPYMILILLFAIYQFNKSNKSIWAQRATVLLFLISVGGSFLQSFDKVDLETLQKNIEGDKYEGYTPDWQNYLSMSEYVGKNLPKDSYVAARKPNMARLYANGKKFYGIYRYDTDNPDALLKRLKDKNVTHVIMASLRKNPAVNNGQTINTIHRYLYLVSKKYPQLFILQHQIGKKDQEPAYLFKVNYEETKN